MKRLFSIIPLELQEKNINYFLRNSLLFSPCGGGETTIQRVRKISEQLKKAAYWGRKLLREALIRKGGGFRIGWRLLSVMLNPKSPFLLWGESTAYCCGAVL